MDLNNLLSKIDAIDNTTKSVQENSTITEEVMPAPLPEARPSMNVNMTATGAEGMAELLSLISSFSLEQPSQEPAALQISDETEETDEAYANAPDTEEKDIDYMTNKLAGGMNKPKKTYDVVSKGDNPMQSAKKAEESIRRHLQKTLEEYKEN